MTLPGLINKTNNTEYVIALKKSYEVLSQVVYKFRSENGSVQGALSNATTNEDLANIFIAKLNVKTNCGENNEYASGCMPDSYGSSSSPSYSYSTSSNSLSTIITNDGMSYGFANLNASCNATIPPDGCGRIFTDINGPNKGPNLLGRDIFVFMLTKDGLYPFVFYSGNPIYRRCGAPSDANLVCAQKVLTEGAMNY